MKYLLIISALFFISVIALIQCSDTVKKEVEINYISKARAANRMYLLDYNPEIKIPILSNEHGIIISDPDFNEKYEYVSLTGGYFKIDNIEFYYESIIGIEKGNKNATFGVSGIDIIYFRVLEEN